VDLPPTQQSCTECADLDEAVRDARRAWEIVALVALTDLPPGTGIIVDDAFETVLYMPFGGVRKKDNELCNEAPIKAEARADADRSALSRPLFGKAGIQPLGGGGASSRVALLTFAT